MSDLTSRAIRKQSSGAAQAQRRKAMKRRVRSFLVLGVILVALTTLGPSAAIPVSPAQPGERHCVVIINPVQAGEHSSTVSKLRCFVTFSNAIAAATGGTVHLPPSVRPSEVTEGMLQAAVTTVLGIDYVNSNFGGNTLTWTSTVGGCSSTQGFNAASMPSGWNDQVSSARSFANCNTYWHFEHSNYGGAQLDCGPSCSSMGVMNDKTSSEKWRV